MEKPPHTKIVRWGWMVMGHSIQATRTDGTGPMEEGRDTDEHYI